jgi:DNA-binding transcriptional regulator YiaG
VNEILYRLGVPRGSVEAAQLREGALAPDKWGNYPHHYGKSGEIETNLLDARVYFLRGDLANAYFNLGVALHYIQDSYTSLTSRSDHHSRWEHQIEEASFVTDLKELVLWAFRDREDRREEYLRILSYFNDVSGEASTLWLATLLGHDEVPRYGKPKVDLNFGYWASFLVTKSVFGSTINVELQNKLGKLQTEYETKLTMTETAFVDSLTSLIRRRDGLQSQFKTSNALKRFFLELMGWVHNLRVNSMIKKYEEEKHLKKVATEYQDATQRISSPHVRWYRITIPKMDIKVVEKELLSQEDVSKYFEVEERTVQNWAIEGKITAYYVGKREFFRKDEIAAVLARK